MAVSKKEALLQAAKDLFGECGYNETTFKKIAERADVAMGLMTHHFGNKEKLFLACGLDVLENFHKKLSEATASAENGMAAVYNYCKAYLDFSVDKDSNWLVLVRCSPYSDMKTKTDRESQTITVYLCPGKGPSRSLHSQGGPCADRHHHCLAHGGREQNACAHTLRAGQLLRRGSELRGARSCSAPQ